jgi:hypothetical protein
MGALIRFLNWLIIGTGAVAGYVVIGYAVKFLYQHYRIQQQQWAECLIREYQRARKEQLDKMLAEAAYQGDGVAHALIGADHPMGMRVQTEAGTFDLPPFYQDVFETPDQNELRLREHIDAYAYEMPEYAKDALVEEIVKHAFPAELEVQIKKAIDNLDPEDFKA